MNPATDIQLEVLDFIKKHIIKDQRPPTLVEISDGMGWSSPNAARDVVNALVKKRYLDLTPGKNRNIKVLNSRLYWVD